MFNLICKPRSVKSIDLSLGVPQRLSAKLPMLDLQIGDYANPRGASELIGEIATRREVSEKQILITKGAIGAIDLIFRSYLKAGDIILLPRPVFPPFTYLAEFLGARVEFYNSQIDLSEIENKLSNPRTKLILLNFPHNPTGRILSRTNAKKIANLIAKNKRVKFISDEVYCDFDYTQKNTSIRAFSEEGFVVRSMSKSFHAAGIRIGYIEAREELLKPIETLAASSVGAISSVDQAMATHLLKNFLFSPDEYKKARNLACEILDNNQIGYIYPYSGIFVCIKTECFQKVDESGIKVVDGKRFHGSEPFIRASFAVPDEIIRQGFSKISQIIKNGAQ